MTASSKKVCATCCHEISIPKIDKLFRKRVRVMNDHIEIIARGIAEFHQRFDDLEKTLFDQSRVTPSDHKKIK